MRRAKSSIIVVSLLLMGALLLGQAPTSLTSLSRLYLYYKLAGASATSPNKLDWLYIDWPLLVENDAAGHPHLKIDSAYGCTPHRDVYRGPQQASYTLTGTLHPQMWVSVYVNGVALMPSDLQVLSPPAVQLVNSYDSPTVDIRYCTI